LLNNQRRVGHPLRDEYAGSIPPALSVTFTRRGHPPDEIANCAPSKA